MSLRLTLSQFNPCVGDIDHNITQMLSALHQAEKHNTDLLVFPEMSLTGYPPEDLLQNKNFLSDIQASVQKFAAECSQTTAIVGYPEINNNQKPFNSLALLQAGLLGARQPVHEQGLGSHIIAPVEQRFDHRGVSLGRLEQLSMGGPEANVASFRAGFVPLLQDFRHVLGRLVSERPMGRVDAADFVRGELMPPIGQFPQLRRDAWLKRSAVGRCCCAPQ